MLTSFEPATCRRLAPCGFPVGRGVAHQHNAVGGPEGIYTRPEQAPKDIGLQRANGAVVAHAH